MSMEPLNAGARPSRREYTSGCFTTMWGLYEPSVADSPSHSQTFI